MKKYIAKFAVVACVAMLALNSQSQAGQLNISFNLGKSKQMHCVEHRCQPPAPHHAKKMPRKHHCCEAAKPQMPKHRPAMAKNRKDSCRHGH